MPCCMASHSLYECNNKLLYHTQLTCGLMQLHEIISGPQNLDEKSVTDIKLSIQQQLGTVSLRLLYMLALKYDEKKKDNEKNCLLWPDYKTLYVTKVYITQCMVSLKHDQRSWNGESGLFWPLCNVQYLSSGHHFGSHILRVHYCVVSAGTAQTTYFLCDDIKYMPY